MIDLESSTPQKFSHHFIVRLPDVVWASNVEAGAILTSVSSDSLRDVIV